MSFKILNKLSSWKVSLDLNNPITSLEIFGEGLSLKETNNSKTIFLNKINLKLIELFNNKVIVYSGPAVSKIFYRIINNKLILSNISSELFFNSEKIFLNTNVLIQCLQGTNYPNDNLFVDIKLLDSSSIYEFKNGDINQKSSIKNILDSSLESINNLIIKNFEKIIKSKKHLVILISGGYDSRLNLALALELQKKYQFKIDLFHEYKNDLEYKIVKNISAKTGLNLEVFQRNKENENLNKIILNKNFIDYNSGIYRDNIPRWINTLDIIKKRIPDTIIIGLGVEAHKGKYYRQVENIYDFKKVFGNSIPRCELISKSLDVKFDKNFEKSFFKGLVDLSSEFNYFESIIDNIHYQTYCSNGYKKRCEVFMDLFDLQFPLIDDNFFSHVFSVKKEKKIDFYIVKNLIKKLNMELNEIQYSSANSKALEPKKPYLKTILKNDFFRKLIYNFFTPKRKGHDFIDDSLRKVIIKDKPVSKITKSLHDFLLGNKNIPIIRVIYAFQLYNYFKLIENKKNIVFECR